VRLLLALLLAGLAGTALAEPLRVCVDEHNPPFSARRQAGETGFDLALARAVADRLGRPLALQWFEAEYEKERSAPTDAAALLAAGRCDLVAGFALHEAAFAAMPDSARLPDYAGAKRGERGRRVAIAPLAPSRPYYFAALAVITAPSVDQPVAVLDDLKGQRVGAAAGTLADAILRAWHGGVLLPGLQSLAVRANPLDGLADGSFDATLIELPRWDAWRARHRGAGLRDTGYRHPLGFNLGFAALASRGELIAAVDGALEALLPVEAPALAAEAGLSWSPPRQPAVLPRLTLRQLVGG
jgi:ABC-type amino acid transport substrate-binding protein